MDISKLPKLSKTDPPPANEPVADQEVGQAGSPPIRQRPADPVGIGAEVWFGVILALVFLYLGHSFFQYEVAHMMHKPFHTNVNWATGDKEGQEVEYPDLIGYTMISDAGIFTFGIAILVDALVKAAFGLGLRLPAGAVYLAILIALAAVILNIYVSIKIMGDGGYAPPWISFLAVAFGGFIVADLARILKLKNYPARP